MTSNEVDLGVRLNRFRPLSKPHAAPAWKRRWLRRRLSPRKNFAFMLQQRRGVYLWLGQRGAAHSAALHHPSYDFNDDVLAFGVRWFVAVARLALHATLSPRKE